MTPTRLKTTQTHLADPSAARLRLALAAGLLVCVDPACAGGPGAGSGADSTDSAATSGPWTPATTTAGDVPDAPPDGSGTTGDPVDSDAGSTADPGDSTTTETSTSGGTVPPGACDVTLDLPVDCAAIARIVPTGIGVSEAHVARRHLRLEDAASVALGPEYQACLFVTDAKCQAASVAVDAAPSRSITGLLVRPDADPEANAALAEALIQFLDGRPADEAIGVFRWGAAVTQISTPTTDRGRLRRLVRSGLRPLDGEELALADALAAVADPLVSVRRHSHLSLRQLLVVAPGHPEPEPGALELGDKEAHLRVELLTGAEVEAALVGAASRLDATLAAGELVLRQCGLDGAHGLRLRVAGSEYSLALADLEVPGADQVALPHACDPADQGLLPALPEVLAIDLTPMEHQDYEARVDDLSKEPFLGALRSDLNAEGVRATVQIKLHGQSSLKCERKSLSLTLTDDHARQWLPDSGTDHFLLVSMCKDDRYITQFTANQLMARAGLFAPKFRMVELKIDDVSQGVYLLLEKPKAALKHGNTRPRIILRRASDYEGQGPALKYAADDEAAALATYEALLSQAESLKGVKLEEWLDQSMDLDQYLRWIALMSALDSGDFVDEVYFLSTEVTGPDASAQDYFSISTWDQDDIFKACHNAGMLAILDPHGMLKCAESRLDHAIFSDAKIYERFALALQETLAWLDQETFDAAVHASEDQLLEVLVRDEARAAMIELLDDNPEAIDYEVAEDEVLARGEALREAFAKRRAFLVQRLADYGV